MNNNKEVKLLYTQIYTSIGFIIAIFIAIILTYNDILEKETKEPLFTKKNQNNLNLVNRIFFIIIALVFTYINYEFYQKNKDNLSKDELIASILTLSAAFILLYTTIKSIENNIQNIDINVPLV